MTSACSRSRRLAATPILVIGLLAGCARPGAPRPESAPAPTPGERPWVASWAASPQPAGAKPEVLHAETLREVVHLSAGGDAIRLHLSNAYGNTPLEVAAVRVAASAGGARTSAASDRPVLFHGATSVAVPAGAVATSDPVSLRVAPGSDVAVSLAFAGTAAATTIHLLAGADVYVAAGDMASAPDLSPARTLHSWLFLSGVDVRADPGARGVVAFGDSITDGMGSTSGSNHRWPDRLSERLRGRAPATSMVNAGIIGNRLLANLVGDAGLARFERDVLSSPGVSTVIVLIGINDLAAHAPEPESTPEEVIAGHRKLIALAKARGLRVLGATMPPFEGVTDTDGFFLPSDEPKRQAVNAWIRSGGAYDAVIDFDRVIADPSHPTRIAPAFDSGDHLHPNDAGYQAMADAVDLARLSLLSSLQ